MTNLNFTKQEIIDLKEKIYFTDEEEKVLDMWLCGCCDTQIYMKLNISPRTLSRRKASIKSKIKRVL